MSSLRCGGSKTRDLKGVWCKAGCPGSAKCLSVGGGQVFFFSFKRKLVDRAQQGVVGDWKKKS